MKLIYIESKFKNLVEKYLLNNNPEYEHGGFFVGRDNLLLLPLFLPNISKNQLNSYLPCENWKNILDLSIKVYQMDLFIHFHSHPNNSIVSEQDIKVAMNSCYGNPEILLQYDKSEKKFNWKGYSSFEELKIVEIDRTFEDFKEYYSKMIGLINFGNIFVDENFNIFSDKKEGKMFINIDKDTYKLYLFLKKMNYTKWNIPTQSILMKETELTLTRFKLSIEKLKKNGMFVDIFK